MRPARCSRPTMMGRGVKTMAVAALAAAALTIVLAACGGSGKTYDISPIFPLSPGKCAKYGGTREGSAVAETCLVTKSECERAVADWNTEMRQGGVEESMAIEFSCK